MAGVLHKASALLMVSLVALIVWGGTAHAMVMGCSGPHCASLMSGPGAKDHTADHTAHSGLQTAPEGKAPPADEAAACDQALCHAVALVPAQAPFSPAPVAQSVAWQVVNMLKRPPHGPPERPPNL
ncbi:hypothetical protein [Vannielia sp.]|uniref:hypothetical protein n=1 Tax=Vannielia sp. TaxID=2813045 RepID=UPI0026371A4B|nr:hypothetical protein [Vannielia sp.]MDF1872289.1 hypothetical protein [Vannielia sp.]